MNVPITGIPGVGNPRVAVPREILSGNVQFAQYVPGLHVIDGSRSRDPLNYNLVTTDYDVLRAGTLLGKVTATGKYAPSVVGVLTAAVAAGATTVTVAPPVAVEIVRRLGASGTFKITGPPAAGGTVATQVVTYSAVNTSTGVITCTATGVAGVVGSFVQPTDGSETIITLLGDRWGVKVTDVNGNSIDVLEDELLLLGFVKTANVINYPSDSSLVAWVKAALHVNCPGLSFDDAF